MGRRCLVTGASGFLGRALSRELARRGRVVRAAMRRPAEGPWTERAGVDLAAGTLPDGLLAGVDVVFHLAGKVHDLAELAPDEDAYRAANVAGTRALLCAAAAAGVRRFVFMSSLAAVGDTGDALADESVATPPTTPYGRTKLEAERLVLAVGERHGMHVCNLRPALVYGAGGKGNLPRMLEAIDRRRFPSRALGRRPGRATVPRWCLTGLARAGDLAGRAGGRRFPFDSAALERLTGSAWFSPARIARELGFQPAQTLETALPEMVAEYRRAGARPAGGSRSRHGR